MPIELLCICGKLLRVGEEMAGGKGRCPACGTVLDIPSTDRSIPQPTPASLPPDASTALTDERPAPRLERGELTDAPADTGWKEAASGLPDTARELELPAYRLASPAQIGGAGFLGGPLGGFLLMGLNYARCGRSGACWSAILVGLLLTLAAVIGASLLPETGRPSDWLLPGLPLWIGTYVAGRVLQGRMVSDHQARGGRLSSSFTVLGFSLLALVFTLCLAFGAVEVYEVAFGDLHLQVNQVEEIYYSRDIPEADARTLARVLQEQHFFNGAGEKTVRLHTDRRDNVQGYVLIVILSSGFQDAEVGEEMRFIAREVSHVLGGRPVRVQLCDESEKVRKELPAESAP